MDDDNRVIIENMADDVADGADAVAGACRVLSDELVRAQVAELVRRVRELVSVFEELDNE